MVIKSIIIDITYLPLVSLGGRPRAGYLLTTIFSDFSKLLIRSIAVFRVIPLSLSEPAISISSNS